MSYNPNIQYCQINKGQFDLIIYDEEVRKNIVYLKYEVDIFTLKVLDINRNVLLSIDIVKYMNTDIICLD